MMPERDKATPSAERPLKNEAIVRDAAFGRWLLFRAPSEIIETCRIEDVVTKLRCVEDAVNKRGLHAAGFIAYEAAPAFDSALPAHAPSSFPLLWFGLYPQPEPIGLSDSPLPASRPAEWQPDVIGAEYERSISQIKDLLAAGETYQVNYTFRLRSQAPDDPWAQFLELAGAQTAGSSAYIDTGRFVISSASPELFFRLDGDTLVSRPMKGTTARGRWLAEDETRREQLHNSEKNCAENVMIVDMIRNDMGRVAEYGSVRVPSLFDVERYPTLWQMTSTVEATTQAPVAEIMAALFPCASVTGAPKPNTMRIIAGLETSPRHIYTGCIGYIAPGRRVQFNVAIRTVLIDRETRSAEYGVGGGIVWDSESTEEYAECMVKARVLAHRRPEFSLLETILWNPEEGFFLLPYHLRRLIDSATYFGFSADRKQVERELASIAENLQEPHRVRLLLSKEGAVTCEAIPLSKSPVPEVVRLRLAPEPVDSSDPFLFHKTTNRVVYDSARSACPDCDDVLLWNERGEVTETTICNLVVRLDGELVTPPVASGLLAGTYREWLLEKGEIRKRIITLEDLDRAESIYVINSVRKRREAVLITTP